jgi:hypothetical protein
MSGNITVACDCGSFHATLREVSPTAGARAVCYCKDCQAFPSFLGRAELLNPHGGTDMFQTTPGRLKIDAGGSNLACVRMTEKGPLRWYTTCCKTPIANTMASASVPFLGLHPRTFTPASGNASVDFLIGHSRGGVFTESATSPPPQAEKGKGFPRPMVWAFFKLIFTALFSAEKKRSAFFTDPGKQPLAQPQMLTPQQRAQAYSGN